ncbi:MAG TPA: XdhC family protein, partial [Ferruginibacter sp.]|nr:XdhC family protein [Ferruginibacter sp.]
GYLETEPAAKAAQLADYGMSAVGGFLPVVLHDPQHDPMAEVDEFIDGCLASGAGVVVLAAATGVDGYDDRPELSTMIGNVFADERHLTDYASISESLQATPGDYVVIMTIGYRTDKIVLRQLLNMPFAYLGMLGSARKTETLFAELKQEGVGQDLLERIHAPIGINIDSKTTREIAVSIAAEIIRYKNRDIPSGRTTL